MDVFNLVVDIVFGALAEGGLPGIIVNSVVSLIFVLVDGITWLYNYFEGKD